MNSSYVTSFLKTIFLICFLALPQISSPAFAQGKNSYMNDLNARFSSFELNKSDDASMSPSASASTVQSRHHRFGAETGIGSSTMQTQSATVESMPRQSRDSSGVSPSLQQPRSAVPALTEIRFSTGGSSQSPAFSSVLQSPSALQNSESNLSSPFSSNGIRYSRRQGKGIGDDLIDPLSGL